MRKKWTTIRATVFSLGVLCGALSLAVGTKATPVKAAEGRVVSEVDRTATVVEINSNMKTECMPYYYPGSTIVEGITMSGTKYNDAIRIPLSYGSKEKRIGFQLNHLYSTVSFEVGHIDNTGTQNSEIVLKILKDGVLDSQYDLNVNNIAKMISCDVRGVSQFEILITYKSPSIYDSTGDFGIGALQFVGDGEQHAVNLYKESNMSEECTPYYLENAKLENELKIGGVAYADAIRIPLKYGSSQKKIAFNLREKYSNLSFDIGHVDATNVENYDIKVSIYKDSLLDATYNLNRHDIAKTIDCEVSGVSQLEIVISHTSPSIYDSTGDFGIGAMNFQRTGVETANGKVVNSNFLKYNVPYSYDQSNCLLNQEIYMGGVAYKEAIKTYLRYGASEKRIGFNLRNEYKTISFEAGHIDGSALQNSNVSVSLYGDGNLIDSYDLKIHDIAKPIVCDVTGVFQFEIVFTYKSPSIYDETGYFGIGALKGSTVAEIAELQLDDKIEADFLKKIEFGGALKLAENSAVSAKILQIEAENIVWSSSDISIVDPSKITCTAECDLGKRSAVLAIEAYPKKTGTVVITGTTANGTQGSCTVEVVYKTPVTEIFTDVFDDWYTDYVRYVFDKSLMTGIKGTSEFRPNVNVSKAQVAQVLYNMESQPTVTNKKVFRELKDVYEAEWYGDAVAWAYNTGVVTGDLNTKKFSPNANVTREQLALMLYRYADYKGYSISKTSNLAGLKNAENTSDWALAGVKWAVGTGLISGVEKNGVKDLQPQGNATRAQVAAILQRFCEENNLY